MSALSVKCEILLGTWILDHQQATYVIFSTLYDVANLASWMPIFQIGVSPGLADSSNLGM